MVNVAGQWPKTQKGRQGGRLYDPRNAAQEAQSTSQVNMHLSASDEKKNDNRQRWGNPERATAQKGATEGRAMGKLDVVLKQHAELRQEGVSTVSPRVHEEEEEEENVAQKSDIPMAGQRKLQGLKGY